MQSIGQMIQSNLTLKEQSVLMSHDPLTYLRVLSHGSGNITELKVNNLYIFYFIFYCRNILLLSLLICSVSQFTFFSACSYIFKYFSERDQDDGGGGSS